MNDIQQHGGSATARGRGAPEEITRTSLHSVEGYYGPRDQTFLKFLKLTLKKASDDDFVDKYVNDDTMPLFHMAFTSSSVDEASNYETFEQMGDATIGKFIVWNSYEQFPQLRGKSDAVEIVARMKINMGSKESLSQIAEDLGMWPFISASEDLRHRSKKKLLEDVFEAFVGVTEFIILENSDPNRSQPGLAYSFMYRLLKTIFEPYLLTINYGVLVDPKNRLKGVFDQYREKLGMSAVYKTEDSFKNDKRIFLTKVYDAHNNFLGEGAASLKKESEKKASEMAIQTLERKGYKKTIPGLYQAF